MKQSHHFQTDINIYTYIYDIMLLLLLLNHFSRVRLCATPETAAHQAPPSLGFSRQEHWSGLPFPSPMHESEKWKWSRSVVSSPQRPHGLQPTRLLHPWDFPGKSTRVGCHCLLWILFVFNSNKHLVLIVLLSLIINIFSFTLWEPYSQRKFNNFSPKIPSQKLMIKC